MLRIIFLLGMMTVQAKAVVVDGGDVGNGGDVVECPGGYPFAHKLLDFYEASVLSPGSALDLGGPTVSVDDKVQMYLARLSKVSPVRGLYYKTAYSQFFASILWLQGQELQDIQDSAHLVLPVQCKIRQLAIRLPDQRIPGKKYLINQDIWEQLDNDQKAGLIMHEIIYEEAVKNGHLNSIKARKLNSWMASQEFSNVTKEEFTKFMLSIHFPSYEMILGYDQLYLSETSYSLDGILEGGITSHTSLIPVPGGQELEIGPKMWVYFYPNGRLREISGVGHCNSPKMLPQGYDLVINGNHFVGSGRQSCEIKFYENGMIKLLSNADKTNITVGSSIGSFVINSPESVHFNENGTIRYVPLSKPITINSSLSPDLLTLDCIGFDLAGNLNLGCLTQPARLRHAGGYITSVPWRCSVNYDIRRYFSFSTHPTGFISQICTDDVVTFTQNNQSIGLSGSLNFDESGMIQAGHVIANQFITLLGVKVPLMQNNKFDVLRDDIFVEIGRYHFISHLHDFTCIAGSVYGNGNLWVWPNQTLRGCNVANGSSIELFGKQYISSSSYKEDWFEFYSDGKVRSVYLDNQNIEVVIRGSKYESDTTVNLHPNGVPQYIKTAAAYTFTSQSGGLVALPKGTQAEFNDSGFLIVK